MSQQSTPCPPEPSNESEQCCVCMNAPVNIDLCPCQHTCICALCYLRLDKAECPICRAEVVHFRLRAGTQPAAVLERLVAKDSSAMHTAMRWFLSKTAVYSRQVLDALSDIWRSHNTPPAGLSLPPARDLVLLTVAESEDLLRLATAKGLTAGNGYILLNFLVAVCRTPWGVDVAVGSHGVCYHGNLGEQPGLVAGVQLLRYNAKLVNEDRLF